FLCLSLHPYIPKRFSFLLCFFLFRSACHRLLHSFPTRRSSDLDLVDTVLRERAHVREHRAAGHDHVVADDRLLAPHAAGDLGDRSESTRLNFSHVEISYSVFCLKQKILLSNLKKYKTPFNQLSI